MYKISNVSFKKLEESKYIKPLTMHYTQNGMKKTWDLFAVHDAVAIVLYNPKKDSLIFVKQFRPPVYYGNIPECDRKIEIDVNKYPAELGMTIELCSGVVDKELPLNQIAKEEILEECGYDVPIENVIKISTFRSGVGTAGSLMTLYYCEIDDKMKISQGGGIDDELIEVVEMTVDDVKKFLTQNQLPCPPTFMYGIYWFLYEKKR